MTIQEASPAKIEFSFYCAIKTTVVALQNKIRRTAVNQPKLYQDSTGWLFFVWASFAISVVLTCVGIYHMPAELWVKGYLIMGLFFSLGSSFTLAKTMRDNHESNKLINRISEAKTEKLMQEFESKQAA